MPKSWHYIKILIQVHLYGFVVLPIGSKYQSKDLELCQDKFCSAWEDEKHKNFSDATECKPASFGLAFYLLDIRHMEEVKEFIKNMSVKVVNLDDFLNSSSSFAKRNATEHYPGDAKATVVAVVCMTEGRPSNFFTKWLLEISKNSSLIAISFVLGVAGSALLILLITLLVLLKRTKWKSRHLSPASRYKMKKGIATRSRSFKRYRTTYPHDATPATSRLTNRMSVLLNSESFSDYANCPNFPNCPKLPNSSEESNVSRAEINCPMNRDYKIKDPAPEVLNFGNKGNDVYENCETLTKVIGPLGDEYSQVSKKKPDWG